jgi:uncharacterized protein YjbI with pentapeptide repeats/cytochrome c2
MKPRPSSDPEYRARAEQILDQILHRRWTRPPAPDGPVAARLARLDLVAADLRGWEINNAGLQHTDLRRADLRAIEAHYADFRHADLREADLRGAHLQGADLRGADLRHASLQGAGLAGAKLAGARLDDANLNDADLNGARLEDTSLKASQLAGADISGAELPEDVAGFEGLTQAATKSEFARKVFFLLLGACVVSWLMVWNTSDAALLTNATESPLPLINTSVSIVAFYVVAPLILLAIYLYQLLYLQRLWEDTADLPAVFQDGRSIVRRAYPWLPMGLLREYVPRLRLRHRLPLQGWQTCFAVLLVYAQVPLTLLVYWWRCLPLRDPFLTGFHCLLFGSAATAGVVAFLLTRRTLSGELRYRYAQPRTGADDPARESLRGRPAARPLRRAALSTSIASLVLVGLVSYTLFERRWPALDLLDVDVSTKPASWVGHLEGERRAEELALVRGARLIWRNLEGGDARGAFLAKADLAGARLGGIRLDGADLAGADLRGANLSGASLAGADLRGADLSCAVLAGASLREADLGNAKLVRADLTDADLEHATLDQADARYVTLRGAHLYAADLADAQLLGADLSAAALPSARLSRASLVGVRAADADLRVVELDGADLTHADLRDADLRGANIAGAILHCARTGPEALAQAEGAPAFAPPPVADKDAWSGCGWTEAAPASSAGQPAGASEHAAGRRLFTLCAPCHSLEPEFHKRGPSLAGVYGRRAGALSDFAYSRALQLAEIDWNDATLDRYLADPKAFMPRSEMLFVGLPEASERTALIGYLAAVKSGAAPGEPGPGGLPPCGAAPSVTRLSEPPASLTLPVRA